MDLLILLVALLYRNAYRFFSVTRAYAVVDISIIIDQEWEEIFEIINIFFNSFKVSEIETVLQFVSRKYETQRINW